MASDEKEPTVQGTIKIQPSDDKLAQTVTISGDAAGVIRRVASGPTVVQLDRSKTSPTPDQALWVLIRDRTNAISFTRYDDYITAVLCEGDGNEEQTQPLDQSDRGDYGSPSIRERRANLSKNVRPTIHGMDAYRLLQVATEAFLIFECGLNLKTIDKDDETRRLGRETDLERIKQELASYLGNDNATLPYLDAIVRQIVGTNDKLREERLPFCESMLQHRLTCPSMIELIWSYWHEEGMLVQTMSAIALRFQNRRFGRDDPLVNLELDPLRPINNLLWGFIQDEYNRLSLKRRAYEYDHHYGITLIGKALDDFRPADSRSRFLEAFHNMLYRTMMFYREDDDATVTADAFAMLNALREVHLILAEGAHNQYGDLPWTARREMLVMMWLLARPEIREFIRGRHMVPYQEPWMGPVDDMKRLQGWTDVTMTHFHELAIYGEQILLSVRFGNWIDINDQEFAKNWARYWRPEIQRYVHGYHAVTGVDLSADVTDTTAVTLRYVQPSVHLSRRLAARDTKGISAGRASPRMISGPREQPSTSGPPRRRKLLTGRSKD